MTYTERAIKDARESGYVERNLPGLKYGVCYLDPLFWSALGKSRGWELVCRDCESGIESKYCKSGWHDAKTWEKKTMWKIYRNRLIDHIDSGNDIESFFKTIYE